MFCAYVGRPGSGKSYDAVRRIVHNLRIGRVVATNIDGMQEKKSQEAIKALAFIDDEQFHKQFIFLSKDDITSFWKPRMVNEGTDLEFSAPLVPDGALVVLDELHKWINSREWNTGKNKEFAEWGAEHRHDGYDVILITQDLDKIDKQVRSLVDWTYYYRKVNFFGSLVKKRYIKYSYDGDDHDGKPVSPPQTYTYDSHYYSCYKSYKLPTIVEKDFQTHVNVLKHPIFFLLPLVLGWGIWSISKSSLASGDLFGTKKMLEKGQTVSSPAATPVFQNNLVGPSASSPSTVSDLPPLPPSPEGGANVASYTLVKLSGYIKAGDKVIINLGNMMVKLPSPYVQNVDLSLLVAEVKTDYLNISKQSSPSHSIAYSNHSSARPNKSPMIIAGKIEHNQQQLAVVTQGGEVLKPGKY